MRQNRFLRSSLGGKGIFFVDFSLRAGSGFPRPRHNPNYDLDLAFGRRADGGGLNLQPTGTTTGRERKKEEDRSPG